MLRSSYDLRKGTQAMSYCSQVALDINVLVNTAETSTKSNFILTCSSRGDSAAG